MKASINRESFGRNDYVGHNERKKPSTDSVRAKRQRLEIARQQLKDPRYQKQREVLREEICCLEYDLLSLRDRVALEGEALDLHRQLTKQMPPDEYAQVQKRFDKLMLRIPEKVRWVEIRKESKERDDRESAEYEEKREIAAREIIRHGIRRLALTLRDIYKRDGRLPTALIFPEASSRPLRYAVEPLMRKMYAHYGQERQAEFFIKTYSMFRVAEIYGINA
jgi:hypothetical protein